MKPYFLHQRSGSSDVRDLKLTYPVAVRGKNMTNLRSGERHSSVGPRYLALAHSGVGIHAGRHIHRNNAGEWKPAVDLSYRFKRRPRARRRFPCQGRIDHERGRSHLRSDES